MRHIEQVPILVPDIPCGPNVPGRPCLLDVRHWLVPGRVRGRGDSLRTSSIATKLGSP